jgi:dTDP-4-dehydrorhamnose reductase
MINKRCYVTGARGSLGIQVCKSLLSSDVAEVIKLLRDHDNSYLQDLEVHEASRDNVERFLIHCGWETVNRDFVEQEKSKSESIKLAQYCKDQKINMIFISSQSATYDANSNYGSMKYEAELGVAALGGKCLKPGLIRFNPPAGISKKIASLSQYRIRIRLYPNPTISVVNAEDVGDFIVGLVAGENLGKKLTDISNESTTLNSLTYVSAKHPYITIKVPLKSVVLLFRLASRVNNKARDILDSLMAITK